MTPNSLLWYEYSVTIHHPAPLVDTLLAVEGGVAVGASGGAKAGSSSAGRRGQQQTSMAGRPERSPPCCDYVAWETQPTAARRSPGGGAPTANAASSGGCRAERRSPRAAPPAPPPAASPRMRSQCGALEVRPSTITGAGLGLFAARRFEEGDLLPCECAPLPARREPWPRPALSAALRAAQTRGTG